MKRALAPGLLLLASCSTVPVPPSAPASVDQGLLVARVETRGAVFKKWTKWADWATLSQLDEMGARIPGKRAASGMAVAGYVVFFDLPPGRYVLRTAAFPARGVRYRVTTPPDKEQSRSVVLRAGSAAYLGDHGFESRWPEFPVALGRMGRIVGHWATFFLRRPVLTRDADLRVYENGPAQETRALLAVRDALSGTPWRAKVETRLRELGAAEPPKTAGALRPKPLELREEALLSWRDTLKWGEPLRAPEGLAWVRPGGEARVVIFFTTASAPGFAGWDAALAELRRSAAASVEDKGEVYAVRVATRVGYAARSTKYAYAEGTLVGSETKVMVTETVLVPDGWGVFTARLRAPRDEFPRVLPAFREFLTQVRLGAPPPKPPPKQEPVMPFLGAQ